MALHALENVDEAFDVTREFLFPFNFWRWLKLAVVVFFIGGGTGFSMQFPWFPGQTSDSSPGQSPEQSPGQTGDISSTLPEDVLLIAAAIIVALLLLWLVFAGISAVMQFVFIESLRSGEVTIRRYLGRRWGEGLRLLLFWILLGGAFLTLLLGWLAIVAWSFLSGGESSLSVLLFLAGLPIMIGAGVVFWVVNTFTTTFVVPIMIQTESGVLSSWGRLWSSIKTAWKQYLVFGLLWVALAFAIGFIFSFALIFINILVLIPLGIVGLALALATGFAPAASIALFFGFGLLFLAIVFAITSLVKVPIQTFLRYYALLVLGDIEPSLDLVPDRRSSEPDSTEF